MVDVISERNLKSYITMYPAEQEGSIHCIAKGLWTPDYQTRMFLILLPQSQKNRIIQDVCMLHW